MKMNEVQRTNNKELVPEYDRARLSSKNVQETSILVEGGQLNKLKKTLR